MFTAILVSLLWLASLIFFFLFYFRSHYAHISFAHWNSFASQALVMKNLFASVPVQIIKNACGLICCLIKIVSSPSIYFWLLDGSPRSRRARSLTGATISGRLLASDIREAHSPQICTLSSRPSSQSFSPSQSHCLAMHLFLEQANWFHRHDESAESRPGKVRNFSAINQTKWAGKQQQM